MPDLAGDPIRAARFWDALKSRGITFFSGVPDSTFQSVYDHLLRDPDIRYVPAVREDQALGITSAAYFHGKLGGVLLQNSGIGNIVNPLTSFNLLYRIPALLIVGWRGYGGPPNDAPEHWIMGASTTDILDLLEVPWVELQRHNLEDALEGVLAQTQERATPGALLVPPGVIQ